MPDYKTMYLHLFNRVSDAVNALEAMNYGQAKELLIRAQQEGVLMTTAEAVLFELQKNASGPVFKTISKLVK